MKHCNISASASVSPLSATDPVSAIYKLIGAPPPPADTKPPKPWPQPVQATGSQTVSITLSTSANDPVLPKISDANAERLAAVSQVVPLKVIDFGTGGDITQQASQIHTDDVVTATRTPQRGPDIDMVKVQAETGRKVREKVAKKAEPTGSSKTKIDDESKEILRYISEDFVMLTRASSVVAYHVESGDELGKDGFKQYCDKHYGEIVLIDEKDGQQTQTRAASGDIWWAWKDPMRRVVRRIVMEPTSKPESDDNPEVFNRWHQLKSTMAEPNYNATTDDIGILLRHLLYLSDNDTVGITFFLNWLAWLYQNPGAKLPHAILFYSKMGRVGKSVLFHLLRQLFGPPMVGTCNGSALGKAFDDVIEHKRLLFINEMARSDKADGYERFKNMISEDFVTFEGKGRAAKEVRNTTHFIVTTNHADALPLMQGDGRILVLSCTAERQDDAYYEELVDWINGPGPAVLAGALLKWTFPIGWKPHAPVPQTAAARAMQAAARDELEVLIAELVEAGAEPCDKDIIFVDELCAKLNTLYGNSLRKSANLTSAGRALKAIGAELCEKRIESPDGKTLKRKFYLLRNKEQWANATPKQRADHLKDGKRLFAVQHPDDHLKAEVSDE